ncbi:MAG: polynucleotide adenylyltransferase PcnB [Moraxellaceae bacterium]|nr:polynucleotide adenylyltransferase PcnB [Moraxellaceae bacterium]
MADISAKQLGLRKSDLPRSIIEIITTLTKAGYEAYIVGGGVRDNLLDLHPKDFDAVTNAKPYEIKQVFGKRCRIIGRRFQLAHVYSGREMIEVATFRAPPKDDNHTTEDGMITRDNAWGDIKQDFARRDFSINAMYYQPNNGIIKDFCHAIDDIKNKTLRLLGDAKTRIEEDPVRLLRALRFKAKLGFEFDEDLAKQFNKENWALLEQVSHHRLYDETQKMFTGGYVEPLLPLLYEYGAMEHLFFHAQKQPSKLVSQIAHNTDKRIAENKNINPAFFYAGLLWHNYLYELDKCKKKKSFADAQKQSAIKVINRQRARTAIPRFAEQFIYNIWLLQPKLTYAHSKAKSIFQVAEHPRFRAGFDFLLLRELAGEDDVPLAEPTNEMGAWWQYFQTLNEKDQYQAIIEFTANHTKDKKKESKAKKKKLSKSEQKQAKQDSEEKAQLAMLSLNLQTNGQAEIMPSKAKKGIPAPLFTINDNNTNHNQNDDNNDIIQVKAKKAPPKKQAIVLEAEEMTQFQAILLDVQHVPKQRRRRI